MEFEKNREDTGDGVSNPISKNERIFIVVGVFSFFFLFVVIFFLLQTVEIDKSRQK